MTYRNPNKCAQCARTYGSRDTESLVLRCAHGVEPVLPQGKIVTKRNSPYNSIDGMRVHTFQLWDGHSYWTPYKPFCTLRCALAYARTAYDLRMRR